MLAVMVVQVLGDTVKVLVSHVSLVDGPILHDDTIKMLFVEYSFLDIPIQETETPSAVLKPTVPDKNIMFNFSRGLSALFKTILLLKLQYGFQCRQEEGEAVCAPGGIRSIMSVNIYNLAFYCKFCLAAYLCINYRKHERYTIVFLGLSYMQCC